MTTHSITANVSVRCRPVRIGWCVRSGDIQAFRRAARFNSALWGGRFNPIIDVGRAIAPLIEAFRPDVLISVGKDAEIPAAYEYLRAERSDIFHEVGGYIWPAYAAIDAILDSVLLRDRTGSNISALIVEWDDVDSLAPVFEIVFGAYPRDSDARIDYGGYIASTLRPSIIRIGQNDPIPYVSPTTWTPLRLTAGGLEPDDAYPSFDEQLVGVYAGKATDFDDLVGFWNLRACGFPIRFFDSEHAPRLLRSAQSVLMKNGRAHGIFGVPRVFSAKKIPRDDLRILGRGIPNIRVNDKLWERVAPRPRMHTGWKSVIATVQEMDRSRKLVAQLPSGALSDNAEGTVIATIDPLYSFTGNDEFSPSIPNIPEANRHLGELVTDYHAGSFRAEAHGLGTLQPAGGTYVTASLPLKSDVVKAIFATFGMTADASDAGRVARRVIAQMGGMFGCEVFKLRGARKLIGRYDPLTPFTRSSALELIRDIDPSSGVSHFQRQVEAGDFPSHLRKPDQVFSYLLERGAFRAGLKLLCPNCQLEFWIPLDMVRTQVECELCGYNFRIVAQLRDRDWWYRRSGVFGKSDNQYGAIPVALTLLTLASVLGEAMVIETTGTDLRPISAQIRSCEADLIVITQDLNGKVAIALAECKSDGGCIEASDVRNLGAVADAFPNHVAVFLVFAKTGLFAPAEVDVCHTAYREGKRVIMLSQTELEGNMRLPVVPSEEAATVSGSFFDMARVTAENVFGEALRAVKRRPREARKPLHEKSLADLERIYNEHHAASGKLFPADMQCQCEDCVAFRGHIAKSDI